MSGPGSPGDRAHNRVITAGSLIALALGLALGIGLRSRGVEFAFVSLLELFGKAWVNALILLVIPLAVSFLVSTVLRMAQSRSLGALAAYALLIHTAILLTGIVFSVSLGYLSLEALAGSLPKLTILEEIAGETAAAVAQSKVETLAAVSTQLLKFLGRAVLLLMVLSVVCAAIVAKFTPRFVRPLAGLSGRAAEASMRWMTKFLLSLPLAVFALALPMAADSGFAAVGAAGIYVVMVSGLLIAFTLLIYAAVHFRGSVSVGRFARAMIPAQAVAVSTRSSMATMPALMETSEHGLDVPRTVTAVIIPFFVSVFRVNRVVSAPFNFLFLVYVYQLPFDGLTFALFAGAQIILSFGTLGIPSGGKYVNLPIYLAAGIPLEGYILLKAVDAIPDIFKTVLNVTEVMGVTTIVAGRSDWTGEDLAVSAPGIP